MSTQAVRRFYTSGTRRYLPGLLALCRSFRAVHPADELVVVLARQSGLTERDRTRLAEAGGIVRDLEGSDFVAFIESRLPEHQSKYGIETYVKVALTETDAEPFYWIDCDMVVRSAIDPLRRGGHGGVAAASPDPRVRASCFWNPDDPGLRGWLARSGDSERLLASAPSFNCGLMWLNPAELRQAGFLSLAREVLERFPGQLKTADESLFNLLAQRLDIRFLPRRSQRCVGTGGVVQPAPAAAWVTHFVGAEKPWMAGPAHPGWRAYERWLDADELRTFSAA